MFRAITGYRDDLNLDQRWWHRLAKVVGFLAFALVGLIAGLVEYQAELRNPDVEDVKILTTLNASMLKDYGNSVQASDYVPNFNKLQGEQGAVKGNKIEQVFLWNENCNIAKLIKDQGGPVNPPKPEPYCIDVADGATPENIVKYEVTTFGKLGMWRSSAISGLLWAMGIAIPILNMYYRGLVYIVCGPRRKIAPAPEI